VTSTPTPPTGRPDYLAERRTAVRHKEILLALDQYGPGYQRVTGNGLRYVAEIVDATAQERQWLADHVAEHPEVWDAPQLSQAEVDRRRQERGRAAFTAADTAFTDGDHPAARNHLDDAFAYGELSEQDWRKIHDHISAHDAPRPATSTMPSTGQG
jgi:hypothetical protein